LIESRAAIRARGADAVEQNFRAKVLASVRFRCKNSGGAAAVRTGSLRARRKEDEGFRRPQENSDWWRSETRAVPQSPWHQRQFRFRKFLMNVRSISHNVKVSLTSPGWSVMSKDATVLIWTITPVT